MTRTTDSLAATPDVPAALHADVGRFDLHAGALRLSLRPDLGESVSGLWHRGTPTSHSATLQPVERLDASMALAVTVL